MQVQIYSEKVAVFILQIKSLIKTILKEEVGLKVYGNRFYNANKTYSYPISVVIYDHIETLGYFDAEFYELGFHKNWMQKTTEDLKNVIRHEIAHYLAYIEHGPVSSPHGKEFKNICQKYHWDQRISKAHIEFDKLKDSTYSTLLAKIQKLLTLSSSSNPHEAKAAMLKAQKLAMQQNIDLHGKPYSNGSEEHFILKRILKSKKQTAKQRSISKILETFFVYSIFHKTKSHCYLEILGSQANIEIASYVATYLDSHLEKLWLSSKEDLNLKGLQAKNSFFIGIAKGYLEKYKALTKSHSLSQKNALINLYQSLDLAKQLVYPKISQSYTKACEHKNAKKAGIDSGRNLKINPALKPSSKDLLLIGKKS